MATTASSHTHSIQMLHKSATSGGMPHGLGLLTTVASLPPKYRSRYLNIKTKYEIPLDLSVKPISPQITEIPEIPRIPELPEIPQIPQIQQIANDEDVPMATTFTEVYTEPSSEPELQSCSSELGEEDELIAMTNEMVQSLQSQQATAEVTITKITQPPKATITSPLTQTTLAVSEIAQTMSHHSNKRKFSESSTDSIVERFIADAYTNPAKLPKTTEQPTTTRDCTPSKPNRPPTDSAPRTGKSQPPSAKSTRNKATRKLKFDEETSSPVSGTIIRPLEDITDGTVQYSNGDIDPKYNIVEITDETKAELAAIKNVIGDYICRLCRLKFDDAFGLAQHRCACIVLIEYRCPECGKQFNCPANLASHRRWHKPKKEGGAAAAKKENRNTTNNAATNSSQSLVVSAAAATTAALVAKKSEELVYACNECGKKFKRQAYLRKHQLTHANPKKSSGKQAPTSTQVSDALTNEGISAVSVSAAYQTYARSSSASSLQSYGSGATHEDDGGVYSGVATSGGYEYDVVDSMSECSTSSAGYGRLQIVESGLTEEENIAAAALTNLRNCASVIQHTTLAH